MKELGATHTINTNDIQMVTESFPALSVAGSVTVASVILGDDLDYTAFKSFDNIRASIIKVADELLAVCNVDQENVQRVSLWRCGAV